MKLRILATIDEISIVPDRDPDGDLPCPSCERIFVSKQALGIHRAKAHP